ncbi:MAG: hypothetical protein ACT4OF_16300 [Caulobacteraceae bacterium]
MTTVLRHNPKLELNRVEYFGVMQVGEFHDHAAFNLANQAWLGFDCLSVVHPDVDVSAISPVDIDGVFDLNRDLFEPLKLLFMRRSGWICESGAGQTLLSHWLSKRNGKRLPYAEERLFETCEAAGEWLRLAPDAIAALRTGEGFAEVARFDSTPAHGR